MNSLKQPEQGEWIINWTEEAVLLTKMGLFIVMQRKNGDWYWSHNCEPRGWFVTRAEAMADAQQHYNSLLQP